MVRPWLGAKKAVVPNVVIVPPPGDACPGNPIFSRYITKSRQLVSNGFQTIKAKQDNSGDNIAHCRVAEE